MIKLEFEFWRCVQSNTPPSLDGSDASAKFLNQHFPDSIPLSKMELPETAVSLINQYETANTKVMEYTTQKQEAENFLKEMLGKHEIGIVGDRVVTWKTFTQERVDTKTLKSEHPILCKKYVNQTSSRRFSVKQAV